MLGQCDGRPSISCCFGHSEGESVRRAMPIPCRSPTIDGGFDEIGCEEGERDRHVDFADAAISRSAMFSVVADGSFVSSSSQRRPRAIPATNVARVSERIGRASCGGIPLDRRKKVQFQANLPLGQAVFFKQFRRDRHRLEFEFAPNGNLGQRRPRSDGTSLHVD